MKKTIIAVTLIPFFSIAWAGPDMNQAATDVCECLKEPYAQVDKAMKLMMSAQASGDMSSVMSAQGEMMGVISASSRCFEGLATKYPEIDQNEELQQKVMMLAEQTCPNPAGAMMANQ